jgi:hypothetical protein
MNDNEKLVLLAFLLVPFAIGGTVLVVAGLQRFAAWAEEREAARRFERDFIPENADVAEVQATFDQIVEAARTRAAAIRDAEAALAYAYAVLAEAELLLGMAAEEDAA